MKLLIVSMVASLLFSCSSSPSRNSEAADSGQANAIHLDTLHFDKNIQHGGSASKEYYQCNFDAFLQATNTPQLAKDIYLDKEWSLANDEEVLALLDSLTASDTLARRFYFKVVTKSAIKADGYYSEGLGLIGSEFVLNHTRAFAAMFDQRQCHTQSDLSVWADIVLLELGMSDDEHYSLSVPDLYSQKLKRNCANCSASQKETIKQFGELLQTKWNALP